MGMGLLPLEPDDDIPLKYPTMSWRLWYAFADLLDAIGADTTQVAFANDGATIDARTCRQWASLLRPIAPRARRLVRGPLCWFELEAGSDADGEPTSTAGAGVAVRQALFASVRRRQSGRPA